MRRGLFRRLLRERRATAAIEFCFVAPVMLSLMAGIVELGRVFEVYASVNRLATRYAIAWADCLDNGSWTACGTEMSLYTSPNAIANFAPQLTNGATVRMFEVVMNGSTLSQIGNSYPLGSGSTLTAAELAAVQNAIAADQPGVNPTVVVVTASYAHTLIFFQTLMSPFIGANKLAISYTVAQLKST